MFQTHIPTALWGSSTQGWALGGGGDRKVVRMEPGRAVPIATGFVPSPQNQVEHEGASLGGARGQRRVKACGEVQEQLLGGVKQVHPPQGSQGLATWESTQE